MTPEFVAELCEPWSRWIPEWNQAIRGEYNEERATALWVQLEQILQTMWSKVAANDKDNVLGYEELRDMLEMTWRVKSMDDLEHVAGLLGAHVELMQDCVRPWQPRELPSVEYSLLQISKRIRFKHGTTGPNKTTVDDWIKKEGIKPTRLGSQNKMYFDWSQVKAMLLKNVDIDVSDEEFPNRSKPK